VRNIIVLAGLLMGLILPGRALAQPPAGLGSLTSAIGDRVIVTDSAGSRIAGKLTAVAPDGLTLRVTDGFDDRQEQIAASQITTVRKDDPVWNGLLLGLGAGVAAAELWVYQQCGPRGSDRECEVIVSVIGWPAFGGGGAVAGALIDKFTRKLLYRAPGHTAVHVSPLVTPSTRALSVAVSW
jgi:hypothetical protein